MGGGKRRGGVKKRRATNVSASACGLLFRLRGLFFGLGRAGFALAADGPYVVVEIFLAIVYRYLLAGLDGPLRPKPDSLSRHEGFGVRAARVVYVAREVRARAAVDGILLVYREEVTATTALDLFAREDWPHVFDYPPPRRYRARSEQTQPRRRALDGVTYLHLSHAAECNSTS